MADIVAQIVALAENPPTDTAQRLALYTAARKLFSAVEAPWDTVSRVTASVIALSLLSQCYMMWT